MVDDDIAICELIRIILSDRGFKFNAQYKVYGAFEHIKSHKPDLILLDLHLPDGNGLNICKKVKQDPELQNIPVIILTTREFNIEKDVAYEAGADLFMSKPVDKDELVGFIEKFLQDKIQIRFWGVRGSTPSPEPTKMRYGGNTPCVQMHIPGVNKHIILDAGTGIRNLGDRMILEKEDIDAHLLITHPHWDHIQGLPFFKPIYAPNNRFTISMPEQLEGGCKAVLSGQMQYTYFPVTPKMLRAEVTYKDQQPEKTDFDGYSVSFILANHPTNTAVYKIEAHGKTIIYAPDNELIAHQNPEDNTFVQHLIEFCKGADLLIHDAQYAYQNYEQFRSWGHTAWEETVKLGKLAGVKRLVLFSHDPSSTDEYLDELDHKLTKFEDDFESLSLAREQELLSIPV